MIDPVQSVAVILSMAGALLVTHTNNKIRMYAFGAWVIANGIWVSVFFQNNPYSFILFSFYFVTAMIGVKNNIVQGKE
jgi:hypothetical protein